MNKINSDITSGSFFALAIEGQVKQISFVCYPLIHEVCSCYILYIWGNIDLERIWTICACRKADIGQIYKAFLEWSVSYYLYRNTGSLKDEQNATILRCCTIQAQKKKRQNRLQLWLWVLKYLTTSHTNMNLCTVSLTSITKASW